MAEGDVYATLLTNDRYLPGAMVLAHALKDGGDRNGVSVPGTSKKLAVLVGEGRLSRESLDELSNLYDYVIPVPIISGTAPDNLQLLGRLELNETFTKINLWKQTQFNKIVYLDADVLPIVPPDELFDIDAAFAASPDVGWPDCFNSGVMLLKPSQDTYDDLNRLVQSGQSFDGADQGLLNIHFEGNWHRLSFTYNCTPSASYQYKPAYLHFGSKLSVVHFIGASKPWDNRADNHHSAGPFGNHVQAWWTSWDKHYVPKGSKKHTSPKPPSAHDKTGAVKDPSSGFVISKHELTSGVSHWTPPPPVNTNGAQEHHEGQTSNQAHNQAQESTRTEVSESGSTTPTPQSVAATRAPTSKPTTRSEPETKPVTASKPEDVPQHSVATRVFPEQPSSKRQEEYQKTLEAPSNVSSPIVPISKQTTSHPQYHHDQPSKVQEKPPMRPSSPTFAVAGTVYVHRSEEEDMRPDEEVSYVSTYVPPFEAPKSEWDPARSPPPINSSPEAHNISFHTYKNEWDIISRVVQKKSMSRKTRNQKKGSTKPTEKESPPRTQAYRIPGVNPVFPWELRAQPPTRVFADDPVAGDQTNDLESEGTRSDDDDDSTASFEELTDEGLSESEAGKEVMPWKNYRVNQWDIIPGVSKYVSPASYPQPKADKVDFTQQKPLYEEDVVPWKNYRVNQWDIIPGISRQQKPLYEDDGSTTPNPRLRNYRGSSQKQWGYPGASGITPPDKWDPNAKLDDLRKLPVTFLERQARRQVSGEQGQQ